MIPDNCIQTRNKKTPVYTKTRQQHKQLNDQDLNNNVDEDMASNSDSSDQLYY